MGRGQATKIKTNAGVFRRGIRSNWRDEWSEYKKEVPALIEALRAEKNIPNLSKELFRETLEELEGFDPKGEPFFNMINTIEAVSALSGIDRFASVVLKEELSFSDNPLYKRIQDEIEESSKNFTDSLGTDLSLNDESKWMIYVNEKTLETLRKFPEGSIQRDYVRILEKKLDNSVKMIQTGDKFSYNTLERPNLYFGSALVASYSSKTCREGQRITNALIPEARQTATIGGRSPIGEVVVIDSFWLQKIFPGVRGTHFRADTANLVALSNEEITGGERAPALLVHELIHQTQDDHTTEEKERHARDERFAENTVVFIEGVTEALVEEKMETSKYLNPKNVFNRSEAYNSYTILIQCFADRLAEKNGTSRYEELVLLSNSSISGRDERIASLFKSYQHFSDFMRAMAPVSLQTVGSHLKDVPNKDCYLYQDDIKADFGRKFMALFKFSAA